MVGEAVAIVGTIVAGGLAWLVLEWVSPAARVRRSIARQRRVPIAEGHEGVVRFQGTVVRVSDRSLWAPLEKEACLVYDTSITDLSARGRELFSAFCALTFVLDDGTGTVLVAVEGDGLARSSRHPRRDVSCCIPDERAFFVTTGSAGDRRIADVLRDGGIDWPGVVFPHRLVGREGMIVPGDRVSIVGCARFEIDAAGESRGFREAATRYVVGPGPKSRLFVLKEEKTG
jgi:hypothetical protein